MTVSTTLLIWKLCRRSWLCFLYSDIEIIKRHNKDIISVMRVSWVATWPFSMWDYSDKNSPIPVILFSQIPKILHLNQTKYSWMIAPAPTPGLTEDALITVGKTHTKGQRQSCQRWKLLFVERGTESSPWTYQWRQMPPRAIWQKMGWPSRQRSWNWKRWRQ